jgi:tetratricopeptide (TPR) repeat protein
MTDPDAAVDAATAYVATNDLHRAEQVVAAALSTNPRHARLLGMQARIKLGQNDISAAAVSSNAALQVEPDNEFAMRVYTRVLELQGRGPEALWMAWRTATTHPHSDVAHQAYARLLDQAGRYAEAITAVNEALRLSPYDVDALLLRGDAFAALGQLNAAEADYGQARQLNPQHPGAVYGLARTDLARRRRLNAIRGFLAAAHLDPSFAGPAIQSVSVVLIGVLRRAAWLVLIAGLGAAFTTALHDDGTPTVIPRIIAGVGAVLVLALCVYLWRLLPSWVVKPILRQRQLLAVRIFQMVSAVVLGLLAAAVGPVEIIGILASLLVFSLPVVTVVGGFTGEKLWKA